MEAEELNSTLVYTGPLPKSGAPDPEKQALFARYEEFVWAEAIHWDRVTLKHRLLGAGGQGAVYLAERRGADGFSRPIALKVFSPEPYPTRAAYEADMAHVASACGRVALLQSDHVVDIHDFVIHNGLRLLEMEYLDGLDIRQMVAPSLLELTRERVSAERLEHVRRVILSEGPRLSRLQPGVAISILRDCLAALSNLHRAGLVHGDIKPANIMLTRQGIAKLIDIGSAVDLRQRTVRHVWSPAYAAPEILQGGVSTPRTDLASLGYVLVEMLSGQQLAPPQTSYPDLLRGKLDLEQRLPDLLPPEVASSELLLNLCQRLVAPDPARRFPSAQAAHLGEDGAASFHRELITVNLSSEYSHELQHWLEELGPLPGQPMPLGPPRPDRAPSPPLAAEGSSSGTPAPQAS